jgi:hypothetical protein
VGSAAAGSYRELSRELHWAGYLFVGVIAAFLLVVWAAKKLLLRSEAKHMADASESSVIVGADGVVRTVDIVEVDDPPGVDGAARDEGPDAAASDPSNRDTTP